MSSTCNRSEDIVAFGEWCHYIAYDIVLPFYLLLGLAGNLTLLLAFYQKSKSEKTYRYQVLLTVSKTLEVIVFGIFTLSLHRFSGLFNVGNEWYQKQFTLMYINAHFGSLFHVHFIISSLLLAVAMAADRVFALSLPYRYKNIDHGRHQSIAALVCFTLPAISSITYWWFFHILPEGDHWVTRFDTEMLSSIRMQVGSRLESIIRSLALCALIGLNVIMVRRFRERTKETSQMTNQNQRMKAKKEIDKTLTLLNLCQSILMCINQLPHITAHTIIFLLPGFTNCYGGILMAPIGDVFIYLTDMIDLAVVLSINKKMRSTVGQAVCKRCGNLSQAQPMT